MLQGLEAKIAPQVAALVIIDVQNDYCHDDGALSKIGRNVGVIRQMVPRLQDVLKEARQAGVQVIHVRMAMSDITKSEAYLEHRIRRTGADTKVCEEGTWGAEFYLIHPQPGEPIVTKHQYSPFVESNLESLLKSRGIKTVILSGVTTDVCIESTARDAYMRNYHVVFLSDCTGVDNPVVQKATLERIDRYFGHVVSSEEVVTAWSRLGTTGL